MKKLLIFIILFISLPIYSQDNPEWFHLEGVSNPDYKVYLNIKNMRYSPGDSIIADLKYEYKKEKIVVTNRIKFYISENEYTLLSHMFYLGGELQNDLFDSGVHHLVPGSEISVIYQGVYIQAVTQGPK